MVIFHGKTVAPLQNARASVVMMLVLVIYQCQLLEQVKVKRVFFCMIKPFDETAMAESLGKHEHIKYAHVK